MTGSVALAIVASYLLGAIPTSYWVVKAVTGQDLRTLGSGNLGATNLYRQLGFRFAVPVAAFDMIKGAVPVAFFGPMAGLGLVGAVLLGIVATLGHVFSIFVGFKGGKGVATGGGIVLGLAPLAFLVTLVVWAITVKLSGYVSLGSILAAVALPPAVWLLYPARRDAVLFLAALALLVVWFHRANISRLFRGTEHRFGAKGSGATS